jgi:uncharacterized protein YbjT (DUF2867 family)
VLRREELADAAHHSNLEIVVRDVTRPEEIRGVCDGIEHVISCVGITRMKGRLTHMDVDFNGNWLLLKEAERAGVKRFGFISPAGTDEGFEEVPLLEAKYRFEQVLRESPVDWVIFRSGGFFADLAEVRQMAARGPLFVIGHGQFKTNPIDVGDLARLMLDGMASSDSRRIIEVGGPEALTWREISETCFASLGRKPRIIHVPVWLCNLGLGLIKPFSSRNWAMGRLLVFMSTRHVLTPARGRVRLKEYFALHMEPRESPLAEPEPDVQSRPLEQRGPMVPV